jgi:hypothetical protein
VRITVAVLITALAASVALGLLGLWPDLRGNSVGDRRERARISSAFDAFLTESGSGTTVTRIRLHYLPSHALVELESTGNRHVCVLIAEDFGDVVGANDYKLTACDF